MLREQGDPAMDVLVTGSSGLVGSALVSSLEKQGHRVRRLVRSGAGSSSRFAWEPECGTIDPAALEGVEGVVHLAGESVAGGRWNEARRALILESRVKGTRTLVDAIAKSPTKPKVLVSASAIGFYGDTGAREVDERSPAGSGFLADVCKAWEAEAARAEALGVRVVRARIGIVLAKEGGALAKMKLPFQLGVGGKLGDGSQWMSWVALEDVVGALELALRDEELSGPMNVVSPIPVTNEEFTKAMGRALHRPTVLPVPRFALKAAAGGQMAEEMFLGSSRVVPKRLFDARYAFRSPDLDATLARAFS